MHVLIIGDLTPEMDSISTSVREICSEAQILEISRMELIGTVNINPDLIIVCQNWPDEFGPHILDDLVSRFPLSRFVCCYGVWCESDGRTRATWPFSIRVPARSAASRIQRELEIIEVDAQVFPLTAGRDEIFLWESSILPLRLDGQGNAPRISVISGDSQYRSMLEAQLRNWGCEIVTASHQNTADVIVYDLDPWDTVLDQLITRIEPAPLIGMMGLAHPEIITAAKLWGVRKVVTKLAPEAELFHAIRCIGGIKENLPEEC
ncbi:ANTAR domain-containing protein [Gimesia maris]|uniref:Response regulatory domain-containing protein n=1 Tax=Gimesia maris TaxID=122 RepID=A0ABX5YLT3_9PLAN|nr:hypothetical protein [Gimesia maris]EDL57699.1 hypothetical protein PM8797T_31940 [Gimesia maris DSM 8797]QEG16622.1 hypothetical protein GmarT_24880 [Gimesia maris]QGQ30210.1 hypothetical protein F1729_16995 [Gimesia maris]